MSTAADADADARATGARSLRELAGRHPRLVRIAAAVGATVALLSLTQLVFPGTSGSGGGGTPGGILFVGAVTGLIVGLSAIGLVLVYRTLRIINFAQTAIGAAGAVFTFELIQFTAVPFPVAAVLGVVIGALTGTAVGLVLLRFYSASRLVLTVITIVGARFLVGLTGSVRDLPFFPSDTERTFEQLSGSEPIRHLLPFPGFDFQVGGLGQRFGFPEVFAIEVGLITLAAMFLFLRFTRAGLAVRAMAENSERASLLGIGVGGLSVVVWTISGALSAVSLILLGMVSVPAAASTGLVPQVLIGALAAAVLARMEHLPLAVGIAVAIGTFSNAWAWSYPDHEGLFIVFLLLAVAGSLLLQGRRAGRSEDSGGVTWSASEEQRPIPRVLARVPVVRNTRWALIAIGVVAVFTVPFVSSTLFVNLYSTIALSAIVVVSLVVLVGWGGQVSLGQWAFAAVGGVVAGGLSGSVGLTFWLAVPLAAVITGVIAALVGMPALRIPGLFLLVVTFMFAVAVEGNLFSERYFDWLLPEFVERPQLFFLDFEDDVSMYFLCVGALALSILAVTNLRKSRTGRVLIALRENDASAQTFGVAVARTKLLAFAISGTLAGFAGAIFVHHQRDVAAESFGAIESVNLFTQAVIGGVTSVAGALLGAAYFETLTEFVTSPLALTFFQEGGTLLILFAAPAGLISLVMAVRDAGLRIVAQRRQIVVPSLFADYDPNALARRLINLRSSEGDRTLVDQHQYALASELYAGTGVRVRDRLAATEQSDESRALGAAARAVERMQELDELDAQSQHDDDREDDAQPVPQP